MLITTWSTEKEEGKKSHFIYEVDEWCEREGRKRFEERTSD